MIRTILGWVLVAACAVRPIEEHRSVVLDGGLVGTPDPRVAEGFVLPAAGAADVLVVLDDTASMEEERPFVVEGLLRVYDALVDSGADFHFGVTTMDAVGPGNGTAGRLLTVDGARFVDAHTPGGRDVVRAMLEATVRPDGGERPRGAIAAALERGDLPPNQGFLRDDAALHVFVASDAADVGEEDLSPSEFVDWFGGVRGGRAFVHAFVHGECASGEGWAWAEAVGGLSGSPCAEDWTAEVRAFDLDYLPRQRAFGMRRRPVPGTMHVRVTWEVEGVPTTFGLEPCERGDEGPLPGECQAVLDRPANTIELLPRFPAGSELLVTHVPIGVE